MILAVYNVVVEQDGIKWSLITTPSFQTAMEYLDGIHSFYDNVSIETVPLTYGTPKYATVKVIEDSGVKKVSLAYTTDKEPSHVFFHANKALDYCTLVFSLPFGDSIKVHEEALRLFDTYKEKYPNLEGDNYILPDGTIKKQI